MANFEDYLINFLLGGLFIVSIVSFGYGMAVSHDKPQSIMESDTYNISGIMEVVEDSSEEAGKWQEIFSEDSDTSFVLAGALLLSSVWGIIKDAFNVTISVFNILADGLVNTFGIPLIAIKVVTLMLVVGLIFAGWKKLKSGE